MSWFSRIEQTCAAVIERYFAKAFPSDLEPAQIARKLVAVMGAQTRDLDGGGQSAPGRYVVRMHREDFARLQRHQDYLVKEWMQLLDDTARGVNVAFEAPLEIRMEADEGLPSGAVQISCGEPPEQPSRPAPNRHRLRIVEVATRAAYPIDGAMHVGRDAESDVQLIDPSVSRQHAVIHIDGGCAIVRDLGSTNGTFVNGERVATCRLTPGDVVTFGKTTLRLESA